MQRIQDKRREGELRTRIVETARQMNRSGINSGKSGNLSARLDDSSFLITPTGLDYDSMCPRDIVLMTMDGAHEGERAPSSEWRMHLEILLARRDKDCVLHAHPVRSTALACHGRGIPPFHYMTAVAGGADIKCAPYATFGTLELANRAIEALEDRSACLLAHHGLLALGEGPESTLALAVEVETLSAMYLEALTIGEPPRLSPEEMHRVIELFKSYGQPR